MRHAFPFRFHAVKTFLLSLFFAGEAIASCADGPHADIASSARPAPRSASPWLDLGTAPYDAKEGAKELDLGNGDVTEVSRPQMQIFFPRDWRASDRRPVLCCFPGGGYAMEALRKEGTRVARWAAERGMIGIAVKYRVSRRQGPGIFPGPLIDARRCLRLVRRHADAWGADPSRVGVIGFSAGGHLAAMAATLWKLKFEEERRDALREISCRPDFAMMIYPVISMDPAMTHWGTRNQILGSSPEPERELLCSAEKQVTRQTPPVFMAQSLDDAVSCSNSEVMERACREKGVPVRRILYEKGGHGYGMERRGNPTDAWPLEAEKWLRASGWMPDREPSPAPERSCNSSERNP